MLYTEIIAVCSQIHTKHISTLCGHNVEVLNVKPNHWAFTTLSVAQINPFTAERWNNQSTVTWKGRGRKRSMSSLRQNPNTQRSCNAGPR